MTSGGVKKPEKDISGFPSMGIGEGGAYSSMKPIKIEVDLENLTLEDIKSGAETFKTALTVARYTGYHSRKQGDMT